MKPKVSICLITYNHERFLDEAFDGISSQVTDFPVEVVIGEDHSTDSTRAVIDRYVRAAPHTVRPLLRPANIGLKQNFVDTLGHCTGDHVAVLSGDDSWTDPYKLQRQVDFLERNPDHVLIGNNAWVSVEGTTTRPQLANRTNPSFDFSTADLMVSNPCVASQVMFRNGLVRSFPDIYFRSTGEDRRLYLLLSRFGRCRYDMAPTGVYRVHAESITSKKAASYAGRLAALEERIENARMWNEHFGGAYQREQAIVEHKVSRQILELAVRNRDAATARAALEGIDPTLLARRTNRWGVRALQRTASLAPGPGRRRPPTA